MGGLREGAQLLPSVDWWLWFRRPWVVECALQVVAEQVHVEVAILVDPFLVGFDGQGLNEAQAARLVGEDAHEEGAALDFLVEPLQQVGRFEVFVVGEGSR